MDKIISILSERYNLDAEVIEKMIRSEFDFVSTTMEMGLYQSVRLHHLGVWGIKPLRRIELDEKYNR